jgi:hypothetical protein
LILSDTGRHDPVPDRTIILQFPDAEDGMMNDLYRRDERFPPAIAGDQEIFRSDTSRQPSDLPRMQFDIEKRLGEERNIFYRPAPFGACKFRFYISSPAFLTAVS